MKCSKITFGLSCTVLLLGLFVASPICQAQGRLSDRDVKNMMKNLREDTKLFQKTFDDAIKKSVIRKTSREKSATDLVAQFGQQADGMLKNFKQIQKSTTDVQNAVSTAKQIDKLVYGTQLNAKTISSWEKVRSELRQIANAYDVTENNNKSGDATPTLPVADSLTCLQAVGANRAKQLVEECLEVSPATHPPCNVQNSCSLIYG